MCQPFVITLFNSPCSCLVRAKANSLIFRITTDSSHSLSFFLCFSKCCPVSSVYSLPLPQLHWMSGGSTGSTCLSLALIRWRGLYSRHSGLCPLLSDGGCFPPRPGCLRPACRPRLCPLRLLASPPTTAINNLTNNVCNVMITLQ